MQFINNNYNNNSNNSSNNNNKTGIEIFAAILLACHMLTEVQQEQVAGQIRQLRLSAEKTCV